MLATANIPAAARPPQAGLEGDVVFGAAATRTDAGALEVRGVGRDVALRGEAAAVPLAAASATPTVARAEELDGVGDDLDRLPFAAAVFRLPLAPVEPPFDRDRAALGEVGRAVLALGAPDDDVEIVPLKIVSWIPV
jgi:hypothetical protein